MATIILYKYHGIGNDYLILDPAKNELKLEERNIQKICQRNYGVGADGILYGPFMEDGTALVKIFNPDGSEAERSGNGLRIFAKYLLDEGYEKEHCFKIKTKAGITEIELLEEKRGLIRVSLGKPRFAADKIPVNLDKEQIINTPMLFGGRLYNSTCVSVGNPNCVIMMEEVSSQKAKALGPYVENAEYFPNRINMQLCHVIDKNQIRIEIFERGAGYTLASGTGACAAATAAHRLGLVDDEVTVHMPGGDLLVQFDENMNISLTGTVVKIGCIQVAENFFA